MLTPVLFYYWLWQHQPLLQDIKNIFFQRQLKNTSAAQFIEKLGESAIISKKLTYHNNISNDFHSKIHISWKNCWRISCETLKANLQAYHQQHYLELNITKVDLRDETNGLKLFWYKCPQVTSLMKEKRKSQAKGKEIDLVEQSKATDEGDWPQRLIAVIAKIQMDENDQTRKIKKKVTMIMTPTLQVKVTVQAFIFIKDKLFQ